MTRTFGTAIPYNFDINQPGASDFPRFAIQTPYPYMDGLVEDIIVNEAHELHAADGSNVGQAKIRLLPQDLKVAFDELNWVNPIETNLQEYPLKNEIVLVFYSMGQLYYTRKVSVTRKITENSYPGLSERYSPPTNKQNIDSMKLASLGISPHTPNSITQRFSLGTYFKENPIARPLRHFEGDLIIQGRFGNAIRMGSSQISNPLTTTPEPNILISVGQHIPKETSTKSITPTSRVLEDINDNSSCVWLVANDTIPFNPATLNTQSSNPAHLRSTPNKNSEWTGAQIFINSDRVVLNSKKKEVSIFSKTQINLSAIKDISLDSEAHINLYANQSIRLFSDSDITIQGDNISIISRSNLAYKTSGNYSILGQKIFIGSGNDASQPMVLGGDLAIFLQALLTTLLIPAGIVTPVGPANFNPAVIVKLTGLLNSLGSVTSPQSATFNSRDNYVSRKNVV
jgi:hypothetical protein